MGSIYLLSERTTTIKEVFSVSFQSPMEKHTYMVVMKVLSYRNYSMNLQS